MNIKDFMQSPNYDRLIKILAALLIALVVFLLGVTAGNYRASFACLWDNNYRVGFDNPRSVFAPFMHDRFGEFDPHGTVGEIASVRLPSIMIKGRDSSEHVVTIDKDTIIRGLYGTASTSDLVAGNQVIIIGRPDDSGRIEASLVRILPPTATGTSPVEYMMMDRPGGYGMFWSR